MAESRDVTPLRQAATRNVVRGVKDMTLDVPGTNQICVDPRGAPRLRAKIDGAEMDRGGFEDNHRGGAFGAATPGCQRSGSEGSATIRDGCSRNYAAFKTKQKPAT